ncbi:hypothetical protein Asulf_01055 [Archaeoglobus sulfaticallidus PM70-1]|uniref:Uncharacterized protein n=1 Tax=Archaeoglobus sulfaticallidus PM70-1 TaxID=387631 RepID=N0BKM4_9EURY|nr:hypothetical protein [Archaeoglobus sulfaticallidus]AGK61056.1 hypothetical protein Asulf_01055 [Archaeoglobus sulfaticallidus PM70-1]
MSDGRKDEREEIIKSLEKTSISTYTLMSFFATFIVAYYISHSYVASFIISSLVALAVLQYFRKRGVLKA